MHIEPLDKLAMIDRFASASAGSLELLALAARADVDAAPRGGDDHPSSSEPRSESRAGAPRRVLTPAVERVLAWHQRRRG